MRNDKSHGEARWDKTLEKKIEEEGKSRKEWTMQQSKTVIENRQSKQKSSPTI